MVAAERAHEVFVSMTLPVSTGYHMPLAGIAAIVLLVAWRIFRRVRRLVGRQRFRPLRSWFSLIAFTVVVVSLLVGLLGHPSRAAIELAGVFIGIVLAVYGLRRTTFEVTPDGLFYTPSIHIGVALSLLLAGRLAYRFLQVVTETQVFTEPPHVFVRAPLTLLVVGTLAGYYAWFALALIRWSRSAAATTARSGD